MGLRSPSEALLTRLWRWAIHRRTCSSTAGAWAPVIWSTYSLCPGSNLQDSSAAMHRADQGTSAPSPTTLPARGHPPPSMSFKLSLATPAHGRAAQSGTRRESCIRAVRPARLETWRRSGGLMSPLKQACERLDLIHDS